MIKKEKREEENQKLIQDEENKIKTEKIKKKITIIVGYFLLGMVIVLSLVLNLNESEFRALVFFSLLLFGVVWSEEYQILILIIAIPLCLYLIILGSHIASQF